MASHDVGPSSTEAFTANSYQKFTASGGTAFAAGDSFSFTNDGNTIIALDVTTAGTGTIEALASANNVSMTLAAATYVIGPLDPGIFGNTVTITTATAAGDYITYALTPRFYNGLHNPYETSATSAAN